MDLCPFFLPQMLSVSHNEVQRQLRHANRVVEVFSGLIEKRENENEKKDTKLRVYDITADYDKKKLVKFIRKASHSVRGRVLITSKPGKIMKDLASISHHIIDDLLVFDNNEDATLPSEEMANAPAIAVPVAPEVAPAPAAPSP